MTDCASTSVHRRTCTGRSQDRIQPLPHRWCFSVKAIVNVYLLLTFSVLSIKCCPLLPPSRCIIPPSHCLSTWKGSRTIMTSSHSSETRCWPSSGKISVLTGTHSLTPDSDTCISPDPVIYCVCFALYSFKKQNFYITHSFINALCDLRLVLFF